MALCYQGGAPSICTSGSVNMYSRSHQYVNLVPSVCTVGPITFHTHLKIVEQAWPITCRLHLPHISVDERHAGEPVSPPLEQGLVILPMYVAKHHTILQKDSVAVLQGKEPGEGRNWIEVSSCIPLCRDYRTRRRNLNIKKITQKKKRQLQVASPPQPQL